MLAQVAAFVIREVPVSQSSKPAPTPQRILVVEDEYLLAYDLRRDLEAAGAQVLGPSATVAGALRLLDGAGLPDAAVLDVNLGGDKVFPLARTLRSCGVPLVFVTGFEAWALPREFADVPCYEKPVQMTQVLRALGLPEPAGLAVRA